LRTAPGSLLWRPDDYHRDLRARLHTAISPDRSNPDRQLMIAIARSRRPNADHSCRLCSIGCELIRPKTRAVHQITSPMAIATGSTHRHSPPLQSHPAASHRPSRHARISLLSVALKSIIPARHRHTNAGPRFPPLRLIRRLPSEAKFEKSGAGGSCTAGLAIGSRA